MTLVGKMYKDQGIAGFYRGVEVNIMRAIVLNATKMGVYDVAKGKVVESTGCKLKKYSIQVEGKQRKELD